MKNVITLRSNPEPCALIIWLHGLGASGEDLQPLAEQAVPTDQYPVLHVLPNAPVRPVTLNNQLCMPAWYDIFSLDFNARQDQAGIEHSGETIESLISGLLQRHPNISRIFIAGFSQGGALALHLGLHGSISYSGIIGLSTYLPLHEHLPACTPERIRQLNILMQHGSEDEIIPITYARLSRDRLKNAGAQMTWDEYPVAHGIHPLGLVKIQQWLTAQLDDRSR